MSPSLDPVSVSPAAVLRNPIPARYLSLWVWGVARRGARVCKVGR